MVFVIVNWAQEGAGRYRTQAGRHPALHLGRWYSVLVDEGDGHGLIASARHPSSAEAEKLSLPGRRVEMTAQSPSTASDRESRIRSPQT